ncbi:MAG TPA: phosphatase PAP2 family protein [Gammaproteobacteria bacterium]|nr:phosphatase PAP2 family protein [Gammaproteobacteria bacterium]
MKSNNLSAVFNVSQYASLERSTNIQRFAEAFILFILLLCLWAQYAFIGNILNSRGTNYINLITLPLDHDLAFSTFWSLFYSAALIIPFVFVWILFIFSRFNLLLIYRLFLSCLLILIIHYIIYFLFPTCKILWQDPGFSAFWQQIQTPGFLNRNTQFVMSITTPWNSFPSYHIGSAWIILRFTFARFKILGSLFLIWFIGMCLGTITLKVHVIMDGIAAIIISELCYQLFKIPRIVHYVNKFSDIHPRKPILCIYLCCILIGAPLVLYELIYIKPMTVPEFVRLSS